MYSGRHGACGLTEAPDILVIVLVFLAAGGIKGVVGFGLPTLSLAVFVLIAPLPTAMALMVLPSLVTNVWQALQGGQFTALCRRFWPLFLLSFATIFLTAGFVTPALESYWKLLLGGTITLYALITWAGAKLTVPVHQAGLMGALAGAINGALTGLTGAFVVPGVFFLQAMGLDRHQLVQAMGILFTVSTVGLMAALGGHDQLGANELTLSAWGIAPAVLGMITGQQVRQRMPEALFRRVFLIALAALGLYICLRALVG